MELSTERRIAAPCDRVWAALVDPEALRRMLPGCERVLASSERDYSLAFGPEAVPGGLPGGLGVQAHVLERDPPRAMRLAFEGEGAQGRFARGEVALQLAADGDATVLRALVHGHGGGGGGGGGQAPLDAGQAERLFGGFLDRLAAELGGMPAHPEAADGPVALLAGTDRPGALRGMLAAIPRAPLGLPIVAWLGGVVYLGIFVLIFGGYVF